MNRTLYTLLFHLGLPLVAIRLWLRARKAPAILGPAPGYVLEGKSSRFDIYPKKSLRLSVA